MSEKTAGSGMPFNLTTAVALFTLVGGLWVASRNVNSGRPNSSAETPFNSIGDQAVRARLWEDPLDLKTNQPQANAFELLGRQITVRTTGTNKSILLPVMIHGGPYSEDRESRIRSRLAIISALGESGYAPEDENHVGVIAIPWPTTTDLSAWLKKADGELRLMAEVNQLANSPTNAPTNVQTNAPKCTGDLRVGFEWYRSRVFNWNSRPPAEQQVLVLWLDEDQFEDLPAARLALLLNELGHATANDGTNASGLIFPLTNSFASVSLIGPRSSTALRALLLPYGQPAYDTNIWAAELRTNIAKILKQVDVFCPTPSAMDAVLVTNCPNPAPRVAVQAALTDLWFNSFHNFCATDAQLAEEALKELLLRRIDLRDASKHLVLISEWDTFYGRTLALTYAAELARFQGKSTNDLDFVASYLAGKSVWPTNLHCFVYLRGLDGQTTQIRPAADPAKDPRQSPSLVELVGGDPSESKAEGEAQFDYLNRLCDRLKELQQQWAVEGGAQVDAVGICGSDPYDTLVILQVLRRNFPNTVFFTTDLDARFAHPKEQEWARNLIVLSSYGLQLAENLQGGVAPFRDSAQTAQFAATLAALGNTNLKGLASIPPRRFEIGRGRAFDVSVTPGGFLHPEPPGGRLMALQRVPARLVLVAVIVFGCLLTFFIWRRAQRLTVDRTQYEIECLWLHREDIGGGAGGASLLRQLERFAGEKDDPVARWLCEAWQADQQRHSVLPASGQEMSASEIQAFLDFLNQEVLQNGLPLQLIAKSKLITNETKDSLLQQQRESQSQGVFLESNSVRKMRLFRQVLDELFTAVLKADAGLPDAKRVEFTELADATHSARLAGEERYRLRHNHRWIVWIALPVLLVIVGLLVRAAFLDSQTNGGGEPFFFFAGISVWPTNCLRLLAVVLAVVFVLRSYASLQAGIFILTRAYRLPLVRQACCHFIWRLPSTPPPLAAVDAAMIWEHYQQLGRFWPRVRRILPMLGAYLCFCFGIAYFFGLPYTPVRGIVSHVWTLTILWSAILSFLFLAFWIIDAAALCRWFVERFSESPTHYPKPCLRYFARQRGLDPKIAAGKNPDANSPSNESILAEWIDMQLIAELTGRIGRLVYCPFIIFFVLLVSRNNLFDRWPWPPSIVIIFTLNLCLCAASMLILRQSALKAREIGLENLRVKVEAAEQRAAPTPEANQAAVGKKLLQELESLDKGAFAPFWQNPLIGAILIPSGGSVLLEVLAYVFK